MLPARLCATLLLRLQNRVVHARPPDFLIGEAHDPYLRRWWLLPRNRWFNIYLHHFRHSDDDRALHDHPWWNASVLLQGAYIEHTPDARHIRRPGAVYLRRAEALHRVELFSRGSHEAFAVMPEASRGPKGLPIPVWTLFITGPRLRDWGFACPKGWVPWQKFTAARDGNKGQVGEGCGE